MANWVKGKLKIRGEPEDIKRWVEECLHCYFTKWFRDGSYEDELVDDAVVFEHDPKAREMRLDTIEDAYIEGTKRNFVEKGVYGDSYREDEKPILVVSMKAAWNVDETPYIEMSKSTMWISACMDMKWVWSSTGKLRSWRADLSRTGESNLRTTNGNALIRRLEGER